MGLRIFGIQRTGTNYIEKLIHLNMNKLKPTNYIDKEWKHATVSRLEIDEELKKGSNNKVIITIKNPYTWYASIINHIKRTPHDWPFGDTTPKQVFKRFNFIYAEHKRLLLGDYEDTYFTNGLLVRYEDLLTNLDYELKKVSEFLDITLKDKPENINKVLMSETFTEERRQYYIKQQATYGKDIIERVNNSVDWELMEFYGYNKQ